MLTASDPNAAWQNMRQAYVAYSALAREFAIEIQACPELESGMGVPSSEAVANAKHWLAEMDQRVQIHHLRQFVQTSAQGLRTSSAKLIAPKISMNCSPRASLSKGAKSSPHAVTSSLNRQLSWPSRASDSWFDGHSSA